MTPTTAQVGRDGDPHLRNEPEAWWGALLIIGGLGAVLSGGLLLWYALGNSSPQGTRGPTWALIVGVAIGTVTQVVLVAGAVGLGISASGLRKSSDRLTAFLAGTK